MPERRIVRYAVVSPDQVKTQAAATDAEIAKAYQQDRARYAATEKRTITQVVVADQAGATALAAKVKAGTSLADAARAAGLEASTQAGVEKAAYAGTASAQVADAVFAAASGAVIGPVRTQLGWTVAKVDKIENVAGRSLDQVRGEIAAALGIQKAAAALSDIHDKIDDLLSKNATFDEVIADQKLKPVTTPALIASGINPDDATSKPDPAIAPLVAAAFQAADGDGPQLVQLGTDGGFAVVALGRVVRATPRPLAQVRAAVLKDVTADRSRQAARKVAADVLARINKGMTIQQSLAQTKLPIPAARPLTASRAQIAADPRGAPPALALMFSMAPNTAKTLAAPDDSGWFIIKLDSIASGNAAGNDAAIKAARANIGRSVGREYVEQFAKAVRVDVGVKTNATALARTRAELLGQAGTAN
ncbi:peptidylprolyl isomerase [Sphingomonas aurantiaca]|uniref:peptidylprolyl isomerase n=1 Tax=Sphingomonas aurantiaca TaxID=185949 RepID=UPI002FE415C6